ncbi:response regulator (plasmid) [Nitrobacteraceae bacterium UC4446_H13]
MIPTANRSSGRVLIIDDHPVVLYGLRFLLDHNPSFSVCGEATDSASALALMNALKPDFVILDLVLGGRDGIELLQDLLGIAPLARILIYSSQNEWRFARWTIQAGAKGYVSKSEGLKVVARALEVIADGDTYVSDAVRHRLIDTFASEVGDVEGSTIQQLSNRELQILRLIGEGNTPREVAEALRLSVKTVGTYCDRIKIKLQLASLRELDAFARDHVAGRQPR